MKRKHRKHKFSNYFDPGNKNIVLKNEIIHLVPVHDNIFCDFLERHEMMLEKRCIGNIDRYYNDYGELIALQDGIDHFYILGGYDVY